MLKIKFESFKGCRNIFYCTLLTLTLFSAHDSTCFANANNDATTTIKVKPNTSWFTLAFFSWTEKIKMDRNDGVNSSMLSSIYGPGIGYRKTLNEGHLSYLLDGSFMFGVATTQSLADSPITYVHRGDPVYGFVFNPGIVWKPDSKHVSFGLALPLTYRSVQYELPQAANTVYKFDSESKFLAHLGAEFTWKMDSHISIIQRFALPLMPDQAGYLWQVYLGWLL